MSSGDDHENPAQDFSPRHCFRLIRATEEIGRAKSPASNATEGATMGNSSILMKACRLIMLLAGSTAPETVPGGL